MVYKFFIMNQITKCFVLKGFLRMTAEAEAKVPVLAKITSDKVFCYVSMALLMFLPVAEIITEFLI